jgi:GT2 family glycosyltransferase
MGEKRFSLVVATLGRVDELRALFDSLVAQGRNDFEVILVDQNADERLAPVVAAFAGRMDIMRLRFARPLLSAARNAGSAFARGAIVGFPDDDCVYPAEVLDAVDAAFSGVPALGVLTGVARAPEGGLGSGRWSAERGPITLAKVWTQVIAFNLFLRRDVLERIGGFDERLGVGVVHGSCEDTDLVIRALRAGAVGLYDPALAVVHPDKRLTKVAAARAFRYAAGFGYVLRKHDYGLAAIATYLVRPAGGMAASLLRLRFLACVYYWRTLCGRAYGYVTYRP